MTRPVAPRGGARRLAWGTAAALAALIAAAPSAPAAEAPMARLDLSEEAEAGQGDPWPGVALTLRTAPEYASGRYGQPTRTTTVYVPLDIRAQSGRFAFTLRVPTLSVTGPGGFVPGVGTVGGGGARRTTATGLGNIRLTSAWTAFEGGEGWPYLDIAAQLRMPTASAPDLGAGYAEGALRLDTGIDLTETVSLDASLGRRFGLASFAVSGQDFWFGYASATWSVRPDTRIGAALDGQNRVPDAARPILQVGGYVDHDVTPSVTIGAFAYHGLTSEADRFAIGLRLSWRAWR